MTDTISQTDAMNQILSQMQAGSSKQKLLAQMLLRQQQEQVKPAPKTSTSSTDKLRGQLKKVARQNHQLKQKLGRILREREELIEYLEYLLELNQRFAAAVGACECWGEDPECDQCQGHGKAGWRKVDQEAFKVYVAPSLNKTPMEVENA